MSVYTLGDVAFESWETRDDRGRRLSREAPWQNDRRAGKLCECQHLESRVVADAAAGGLDDLRIAVSGVGPHAVRLSAAEDAARGGGDYAAALADLQPRDDALASGWYRARILPTLVARAVASLA